MGIFNSFVNQIGREIGRDVYRNITSPKTNKITKIDSINKRLSIKIESFSPSTYKKVTERKFEDLVRNVISNIDYRFDDFIDTYLALIDIAEELSNTIDVNNIIPLINSSFNESKIKNIEYKKELLNKLLKEKNEKVIEKEKDLNRNIEIYDKVKNKSKIVRLILTPIGLSALYNEYNNSRKISSSIWGVIWAFFSYRMLEYINETGNISGGLVILFLIQFWLFLANAWLRTSPEQIMNIVDKIKEEINSIKEEINSIKEEINSLEKIK